MASTAVASNAIVLEVLNEKNYKEWSSRVKTYLLAGDLWDVVEAEPRPPPKSENMEAEILEAWRTKNAKALHVIKISCGSEMFSFIQDVSMAKIAWEFLERKFKSRNTLSAEKKGNEQKPDVEFDPSYQPFFDYVETGDCDKVKQCLATLHHNAVRAKHPKTGHTALHKAAKHGHVAIVKELLPLMRVEDLEIQDGKRRTALDATVVACVPERDLVQMAIAKYLLAKNQEIVNAGYLPVVTACSRSKWEMARYLCPLTSVAALQKLNKNSGAPGARLINMCIWRPEGLDVAWNLLHRCPNLAMANNGFGEHPIVVLAGMRCAFLSGERLTLWQKLIYKSIQTHPVDFNTPEKHITVAKSGDELYQQKKSEDERGHRGDLFCSKVACCYRRLIKGARKRLGINDVYDMKSNHVRYNKLLACMGEVIKTMDEFTPPAQLNVVRKSVFKAIEQGHVEFVTHMCEANPTLVVDILDEDDKSIFQYAIECRQEKIYNLMYGLKPKKIEKIAHRVAKFNNNMLHSVGNLSPLPHINHIQGAILQMQRELQWFEEVKRILPSDMHEYVNTSNLTARELFTKSHKKLKDEAEISMKGIAASSTTVGALIVTMMFAVAFTAPGGTDGNTGLPMFMHKKLFKIFILSDTISLISSATSVITFLGLLTSTYAEDDFLWFLPTKLMIGLSTLFISIVAMMITFSCALTIMLDGEAKMMIPAIVLATVPVVSFAIFLFPLLFEICRCTYGTSMFGKKGGIKHSIFRKKAGTEH
ncbi:hypothetical protein ABKV19_014570 [Rosa sericea]